MSKKTRIIGLMGLVATGVLIGLLVAPEKGSKTRKKLKKASSKFSDALGGLIHKQQKKAEDFAKEA